MNTHRLTQTGSKNIDPQFNREAIDSFSSANACPPSRAAQARRAGSAEEKVRVSPCGSVVNEKNGYEHTYVLKKQTEPKELGIRYEEYKW